MRLGLKIWILAFLITVSSSWASIKDDPKFQQLERAVREEAETQLELNQTSAACAQYAEAYLVQLEAKIEIQLSSKRAEAFKASCAAWREFRSTEVDFHGLIYEGGSMQPLERHLTFTNCTVRRIEELEAMPALDF